VYTLDGVNSISAITRDRSNPNQVVIPTDDEWYKAAFHQPAAQGGDADDYWLYATRSNIEPTVASATSNGEVSNPGEGVVNYLFGADWNGQNGNVTTVGSAGNASYYGAFDMNGNVFEWNQTLFGTRRGFRGGSFENTSTLLRSSFSTAAAPSGSASSVGFRLVRPVPGQACPSDLDVDCVTDIDDLLLCLSAFGNSTLGDGDGDGDTDIDDLLLVLSEFGNNCT
jgi:hypothetical protein